jgi:hypothetical protein
MAAFPRRALLSLLTVLCVTACGPDFGGAPVIQGYFEVPAAYGPPKARVALLWLDGEGSREALPLSVPSAQELELDEYHRRWFFAGLDPSLTDNEGSGTALQGIASVAYVVAVPEGVRSPTRADVIGMAESYVLVHVKDAIQPGSPAARLLGAALPSGYYYRYVKRKTPAELAEVRACLERVRTELEREACGIPGDTLAPVSPIAAEDDFSADTLSLALNLRMVAHSSELRWPTFPQLAVPRTAAR